MKKTAGLIMREFPKKKFVSNGKLRVKLIAAFVCVTIFYGGFWTVNNVPTRATERLDSKTARRETGMRKGKVVFLLSNQRSGSSFVGEFFARSEKGFYLYEPLHPYGMSCEQLYEERLDFLQDIAQCDFSNQRNNYIQAYEKNGVKSHNECLKANVCTPPRLTALLQRYRTLCQSVKTKEGLNVDVHMCAMPVNLTIWSSLCKSSDVVVFKVLRVCSVRSLERIAKKLADLGNDVYVLELVRDPRGIINSALKLELRRKYLTPRLDSLCGRFSSNLDYIEGGDAEPGGVLSQGKYMRIRYEDITEDPVKGVEQIYRFIGMRLPPEVKSWVESATAGVSAIIEELQLKLKNEKLSSYEQAVITRKIAKIKREGKNPYGTTRNSTSVPSKWRKELKMPIVNEIQERCAGAMNRLGYRIVNSEEEKNDFAIQLW